MGERNGRPRLGWTTRSTSGRRIDGHKMPAPRPASAFEVSSVDERRATVPDMACRGYFLALDEPCVASLLAQDGNDERLIEVIKEFDMTDDVPDECSVDKAWDGIHRCLTEGRLGSEDGTYPLNAVILGGLPLHQGDDYVVSYNTPAEVREVAAALTDLDLEPFIARYWTLDPDEYGAAIDQEELAYLTHYLQDITTFYQRAAQAGRASVFVADQ